MGKKKDRSKQFVPVRRVGKPDTKPRQLCRRDLLQARVESYQSDFEWFDQPARAWRRISYQ